MKMTGISVPKFHPEEIAFARERFRAFEKGAMIVSVVEPRIKEA